MPYGRITTITFTPGGLEQIWEKVPSFVDLLRGLPGFLSYQFFQTGADAAVTIALYVDQDQSDAAAAAAAAWITDNAANLILRRDVRPGTELLFEATAPEAA